MKVHPYAIHLLMDRPPLAECQPRPAVAAGAGWQIVAATVGGILLGLLGLAFG